MNAGIETSGSSKAMLWTGRVISALVMGLLTFSGVMKLMKPEGVLTGFEEFGYPESLISIIGIVELACVVVYLLPQTAVLGAILITGYLGGATATHARVEDPMFVGGVIVGILTWAGIYLRDARVRQLIPLRRTLL